MLSVTPIAICTPRTAVYWQQTEFASHHPLQPTGQQKRYQNATNKMSTSLSCCHQTEMDDSQTTVSEPFAGIIPTLELVVSRIGSSVVLGSTSPLLLLPLPFGFAPCPLAVASAGKFVCPRSL